MLQKAPNAQFRFGDSQFEPCLDDLLQLRIIDRDSVGNPINPCPSLRFARNAHRPSEFAAGDDFT